MDFENMIINPDENQDEKKGRIKPETWMADLPPQKTIEPLYCISIPGSHDSFSSSLNQDGGIAENESRIIKMLGSSCCGVGKTVIHKWSQTQSMSFKEQLEAGVRYFDLRICCKPGTTDVYFVHGLYGQKVVDGCEVINAFLNSHTKEVVILDFNHFYSMSGQHNSTLELLRETFGQKIMSYDPMIPLKEITLGKIWEQSHQMIIFYDTKAAKDHPHVWPGSLIKSPWANCTTVQGLLTFLDGEYNKGDFDTGFHVWQGVLTPRATTIVCNLCSSLKKTLSEKATRAFIPWVKAKQNINVCIADFVEISDYIKEIIALNYNENGE